MEAALFPLQEGVPPLKAGLVPLEEGCHRETLIDGIAGIAIDTNYLCSTDFAGVARILPVGRGGKWLSTEASTYSKKWVQSGSIWRLSY